MNNHPRKQIIPTLLMLFVILAAIVAFALFRKYNADARFNSTKESTQNGLPVGPAFVYPPDKADKAHILDLLKARKFRELTSLLEGYQKDFERDSRTEYTVFDAFDAFSTEGPLIEPFLDEWVSQMPDSYCSHLARGCHSKGRGWASRGSAYASETSEEQFAGMESFFEKARKDLDSALKLNPNLLNAYVASGNISSASGLGKTPEQWFREGEKRMPYSLILRTFYMGRLTPRWGGSYEEMEKFADECDRLASHNPNLKVLRGYIDFDRGWLSCTSNQNAAGVEKITKALSYGEFYLYLDHRAQCLANLQKNEEAMADLDRAVKLRPQIVEILLLRAERLVELKRFQEARDVYSLVSRIDPQSHVFLAKRSYSVRRMNSFSYQLINQNQLPEAMKIANEAQQLDPTDWTPYYFRAGIFYEQHDMDSALSSINKAIELSHHEFDPYAFRNQLLADQNQWDLIIKDMDAYIAIEPKKAEAYFHRARARQKKQDAAAARADLKRACELGNKDACKELKH